MLYHYKRRKQCVVELLSPHWMGRLPQGARAPGAPPFALSCRRLQSLGAQAWESHMPRLHLPVPANFLQSLRSLPCPHHPNSALLTQSPLLLHPLYGTWLSTISPVPGVDPT